MAITRGDVELWGLLEGMLPLCPRVLELGEANWYCDLPLPDGARDPFSAALRFYQRLFDYAEIVAVDLNGTSRALKHDLNEPLPDCPPFDVPFDVVINTGTLEHLFDQRQGWQTAHDMTATGGIMVHSLPVAGWPDHGFYCYQPCLVADVEKANGYQPLAVYCEKDIGATGNHQLHLAWRKVKDGPFVVPRQGRYTVQRDWRDE